MNTYFKFSVRQVGPPNARRYAVVNAAGDYWSGTEWLAKDRLDGDFPRGTELHYREGEAAIVARHLGALDNEEGA